MAEAAPLARAAKAGAGDAGAASADPALAAPLQCTAPLLPIIHVLEALQACLLHEALHLHDDMHACMSREGSSHALRVHAHTFGCLALLCSQRAMYDWYVGMRHGHAVLMLFNMQVQQRAMLQCHSCIWGLSHI